MSNSDKIKVFRRYLKDYGGIEIYIDEEEDFLSASNDFKVFIEYDFFELNIDLSHPIYDYSQAQMDVTDKFIQRDLSVNSKLRKEYLVRLNNEQFEFVNEELHRLVHPLASDLDGELHKRRIEFLEAVKGELRKWFDKNKIKIGSTNEVDTGKKVMRAFRSISSDRISSRKSERVLKERLLKRAIVNIDIQIKKLGKNYKKIEVLQVCETVYRDLAIQTQIGSEIYRAEYLRYIAGRIHHRFKKWKRKQFIKYAENAFAAVTPQKKKL